MPVPPLFSFGGPRGRSWFDHKPADVIMQKKVEIIYDQVIATYRPVGANRPDLIVRDIAKKKVMIVDVACPCDLNVEKKELEKVSKYAGLKAELQRMCPLGSKLRGRSSSHWFTWGCFCIVLRLLEFDPWGPRFEVVPKNHSYGI